MAVVWESLFCFLSVFIPYYCGLYSMISCVDIYWRLMVIFSGPSLSCLSWYAVCLFPYWCSVQDVRIFQIFYSAAYLWSIGECLCALKLGWIQLCCFDLFFLFLSYSYPHRICLFVNIPLTLKWRYLCDLHLLYLVKLSLSVFEHSCVDILFAVFLHSIWMQVKWYSSLSLSFI